ncbi:MAG: VWA domain-containing protein [Alphaproteobacteria bacterium]|nr:VWA domain-containing protein [Alphaproteobacteria bacterium]
MDQFGFWRNTRGNLAITFALAAIPLVLGAGAAVDLMRQANANTLLQAATDAAALAGAASHSNSNEQVAKIANTYIAANDAYGVISSLSDVAVTSDTKAGVYSVRLTAKLNTSFMAIGGISSMNVGAYSEVSAGSQGTEIALVLDNTASMASEGRMPALQAAAKSLVDTVFTNKPANTYLKVGVVPFADYVNVGLSHRNDKWINVPADWTETTKNVCSVSYPNAVYANCHDVQGIYNNDGVPTPYTYQVCDTVSQGNPVTTCGDQIYQHKWYGCVGSRNSPLDLGVGSPGTVYPGIMDTSCTSPLTPLTDQVSTVQAAIAAMTPVGETYIPSGVLWGWNLLDNNEPFTEAKTNGQMNAIHGSKYMVIMTDGENTRSPVYPYHYGSDATQANTITSSLCAGVKKAGITVYTVGFKVQAQTSKDLLVACASDPSKAFDATDNGALQAAFDTIGQQLAALRLSK